MNNATRLKRITSEAKRIRKTKPNMKWVDAVRAASKKLSKSRTNPVKKKAAKKVGAVRTVSKKHTDKNRITANIQFGGMRTMYDVRDYYEKQLNNYIIATERIKNSLSSMSVPEKKRAKEVIASYKKVISNLKKSLREQNRVISSNLK